MGDRVEPALYVDIQEGFTFVDRAGTPFVIDPRERIQLGPALAIHGQQVERVSTENAVLRLCFSDASALEVRPNESFEAWQVVGGSPQTLVVCVGPADVAVWTMAQDQAR
jgi:hypothetical protein